MVGRVVRVVVGDGVVMTAGLRASTAILLSALRLAAIIVAAVLMLIGLDVVIGICDPQWSSKAWW